MSEMTMPQDAFAIDRSEEETTLRNDLRGTMEAHMECAYLRNWEKLDTDEMIKIAMHVLPYQTLDYHYGELVAKYMGTKLD